MNNSISANLKIIPFCSVYDDMSLDDLLLFGKQDTEVKFTLGMHVIFI